MKAADRITTQPDICHGQPVIRGLRYPVRIIADLLASGMGDDEILADYPDLERDDLDAVRRYVMQTPEDGPRAGSPGLP
jgi:uncharacterized protein (DUF433 family)